MHCEFHRSFTNIEEGPVAYNILVTAPQGSKVIVLPERLVSRSTYENQS